MDLCEEIYLTGLCYPGVVVDLYHSIVQRIDHCGLWKTAISGFPEVWSPRVHEADLSTEAIRQRPFFLELSLNPLIPNPDIGIDAVVHLNDYLSFALLHLVYQSELVRSLIIVQSVIRLFPALSHRHRSRD